MKTLTDYIQEHYNGNQSEFGRKLGVERTQVRQWLKAKKPVYVVDDKLVQVIRNVN